MIKVNQFEEVAQIKLSQTMDERYLYWAADYLVDGLLTNTGP